MSPLRLLVVFVVVTFHPPPLPYGCILAAHACARLAISRRSVFVRETYYKKQPQRPTSKTRVTKRSVVDPLRRLAFDPLAASKRDYADRVLLSRREGRRCESCHRRRESVVWHIHTLHVDARVCTAYD